MTQKAPHEDALPRVVILLRGINVGAHHRASMAEVAAALEDAGFSDVRTLLQSGNIVARTSLLSTEVSRVASEALGQRLGFSVPAVACAADTFLRVTEQHPLDTPGRDDRLLTVAFSEPAISTDMVAASSLAAASKDEIRAIPPVLYQWCPHGVSNAVNVVLALHRATGGVATLRNWRTLQKIRAVLST